MARSSRATVEKNKMRLLVYFALRAEQDPGLGTSFKAMESDLGLSQGCARASCRALKSDGLLRVEARFDDGGGQRPNVYVPTPKARRMLSQYQAAQSVQKAAEREEVEDDEMWAQEGMLQAGSL